jgi:hypothetical protein
MKNQTCTHKHQGLVSLCVARTHKESERFICLPVEPDKAKNVSITHNRRVNGCLGLQEDTIFARARKKSSTGAWVYKRTPFFPSARGCCLLLKIRRGAVLPGRNASELLNAECCSTYHQLPLTTAQVWVRQQVVRSAGHHQRQCALAHSMQAAAQLLQAHLPQIHLTGRHRGLGCLIQEPVRRWAVHSWRPPNTPCTAACRTQAAGQSSPMSFAATQPSQGLPSPPP